jgi:hypothetical protein
MDAAGDLYVFGNGNAGMVKVTHAGAVSTLPEGYGGPGIAIDASGNLYIDVPDGEITEITTALNVPFTLGGTAIPGNDYSDVTMSPLTLAPGQTSANITGRLLGDPGPNRTLTLALATPAAAFDTNSLGSVDTNTLTINEPNTAPVTANVVATVVQDSANNIINVLTRASDSDGDSLTVSAVGTAGHGSVAIDGSGQVVYTPASGFSGSDSVSYTIDDGHGNTATATVDITISPVTSNSDSTGSGGSNPSSSGSSGSSGGPANTSPRALIAAPPRVTAKAGTAALSIKVHSPSSVSSFRLVVRASRGTLQLPAGRGVKGNNSATLHLSGSAASLDKSLRGLLLHLNGKRPALVIVSISSGKFSENATIAIKT